MQMGFRIGFELVMQTYKQSSQLCELVNSDAYRCIVGVGRPTSFKVPLDAPGNKGSGRRV